MNLVYKISKEKSTEGFMHDNRLEIKDDEVNGFVIKTKGEEYCGLMPTLSRINIPVSSWGGPYRTLKDNMKKDMRIRDGNIYFDSREHAIEAIEVFIKIKSGEIKVY